jgi:hypothetical protein
MKLDIDFPYPVAVRHLGGHALWLRFSDGVEGVADLSDWLTGPVFESLRDSELFAQVRLDPPFTISWPNGADIAAEALYDRLQPTGAASKRDYQLLFDAALKRERAECAATPELSRFFGIVIRMFWREVELPHFHAQYGDFVASIEIETGAVTTKRFPSQALRLIEDWRRLHLAELRHNWSRMQRGEAPVSIDPLR